jgi:demethylmenaquinone methyltransferase/2-methoxy-6-polyprenyl-1,4-benzoquinol methylase
VLEIAAGTGYWTALLAMRGIRVTALDAAPEALDLNRQRLGPTAASVEFVVADVFNWQPPRSFDSCVSFFWLCHVPDERLVEFLSAVRKAVKPGGTVFFGDKTATSTPAPASEIGTRSLNDGRTFTIIDRPRAASGLGAAFDQAEFSRCEVITLGQRFTAVIAKTPELV